MRPLKLPVDAQPRLAAESSHVIAIVFGDPPAALID
jgi:hypothetical protein